MLDPANYGDGDVDDDDEMMTNDAIWCMHDYVIDYKKQNAWWTKEVQKAFDPAGLFNTRQAREKWFNNSLTWHDSRKRAGSTTIEPLFSCSSHYDLARLHKLACSFYRKETRGVIILIIIITILMIIIIIIITIISSIVIVIVVTIIIMWPSKKRTTLFKQTIACVLCCKIC